MGCHSYWLLCHCSHGEEGPSDLLIGFSTWLLLRPGSHIATVQMKPTTGDLTSCRRLICSAFLDNTGSESTSYLIIHWFPLRHWLCASLSGQHYCSPPTTESDAHNHLVKLPCVHCASKMKKDSLAPTLRTTWNCHDCSEMHCNACWVYGGERAGYWSYLQMNSM